VGERIFGPGLPWYAGAFGGIEMILSSNVLLLCHLQLYATYAWKVNCGCRPILGGGYPNGYVEVWLKVCFSFLLLSIIGSMELYLNVFIDRFVHRPFDPSFIKSVRILEKAMRAVQFYPVAFCQTGCNNIVPESIELASAKKKKEVHLSFQGK
jgi:hypothetical protein